VNLFDRVRVPDAAGPGSASIVLSLPGWEAGRVVPTAHSVVVLPPTAGAGAERVAANLVATLAHPERGAGLGAVRFSPDGKQLFASGYPSGVVQTWDAATRAETRRITTPPGSRSTSDYALLAPDWKTLYVLVETRKTVHGDRAGKLVARTEYGGEIRVRDLATGEDKAPLRPPAGSAPVAGRISPDGAYLACVERPSSDAEARGTKDIVVVWDLATGGRRKLADGFGLPVFAPDGRTLALAVSDPGAKASVVKRLDPATGQGAATLACPDRDRQFSAEAFSPDGSLIALSVGGKKGAPREVWFRDARTLADRGRYVGPAGPERYGWGAGGFTPDGARYVILGGDAVRVWDVVAGKVVRSVEVGPNADTLAVAPDGKTLAVGWRPTWDKEQVGGRHPDPTELPQPRVTLLDLNGVAAPRVLVCPHGYVGVLAFSPDGKTLACGSAGSVHLFELGK
jgi:WD40 repeat protein